MVWSDRPNRRTAVAGANSLNTIKLTNNLHVYRFYVSQGCSSLLTRELIAVVVLDYIEDIKTCLLYKYVENLSI